MGVGCTGQAPEPADTDPPFSVYTTPKVSWDVLMVSATVPELEGPEGATPLSEVLTPFGTSYNYRGLAPEGGFAPGVYTLPEVGESFEVIPMGGPTVGQWVPTDSSRDLHGIWQMAQMVTGAVTRLEISDPTDTDVRIRVVYKEAATDTECVLLDDRATVNEGIVTWEVEEQPFLFPDGDVAGRARDLRVQVGANADGDRAFVRAEGWADLQDWAPLLDVLGAGESLDDSGIPLDTDDDPAGWLANYVGELGIEAVPCEGDDSLCLSDVITNYEFAPAESADLDAMPVCGLSRDPDEVEPVLSCDLSGLDLSCGGGGTNCQTVGARAGFPLLAAVGWLLRRRRKS